MILPLYLTTQESAKRHTCMPALVEKDNRLIRHCRASKYKNGPVIGMRVPLYRGGTNKIHTPIFCIEGWLVFESWISSVLSLTRVLYFIHAEASMPYRSLTIEERT